MSRHAVSASASALVLAGSLAACSERSSYDAVRDTVRTWAELVRAGDVAACELERPAFQTEVSVQTPLDVDVGTDCPDRVRRRLLPAPSAAARLDVPAWDPSGEALVEVREPGSRTVTAYALEFVDDRWQLSAPVG